MLELGSWHWTGGCSGHSLTLLPAPTDSSDGALEGMVRGLRQGGVSLLGQPQPLTQEQWRSSFMRRNRDPHLNERAHRVRALQSTLKVSWGHWVWRGTWLLAVLWAPGFSLGSAVD